MTSLPDSDNPLVHGFLPHRLPALHLAGGWTDLDALAHATAAAPCREEARLLVAEACRASALPSLRHRVARLSEHRARAAATRLAVIVAACGWTELDPASTKATRVANEQFLALWTSLAHRSDYSRLVGLPTLALFNWAPLRKPGRAVPVDQLARTESLVPIVRWSAADRPLSRLDRLMLATVRLEAHGVWLFRLAETLAGRSPADRSVSVALRRMTRIQHALHGQLRSCAARLVLAPATGQQCAVLASLAAREALEPPVLLAADAVLGMGGRMGTGSRCQQRRHLAARHRAWLSTLDRRSAAVRTLAHRRGADADAYRDAQESLVALRCAYAGLVRTAAQPAAAGCAGAAHRMADDVRRNGLPVDGAA
ncbi:MULTISPECIES: hypothetical protein [Streptomyces]|nr:MULTISPECIES: hypothetical protein [Streptomyces]MYY86292.1 hypothetical protein [Streptomyces sp. SID335]NEB43086.1 hypothetical protein [Streptomyces sp. SID339]